MSHQNTGQKKLLNSATDLFELAEMPFYFGYIERHTVLLTKIYIFFTMKSFMFPVGYCHGPEMMVNLEKKLKAKRENFYFKITFGL